MKKLLILMMLSLIYPCLAQEEGYASWYGGKFNGRTTANGEIYDMEEFTAAHKTLPFDTMVKVINLENEKFTIVRINDRGPFVEGRIIDLSRVAAEAIGMLGTGVARVKLEILSQPPAAAYLIQIGAYSQAENAYTVRERLEQAGLQVACERTAGGLIRVVVTGISAAELAEKEELLKQLTFRSYLVKKYSVH